MNPPIRCQGLSKKFRRVSALDNIQLEVPPGSIYALIGPNGAGKTTLVKTLMNLLPPSRGRAFVLGADSRRLSPRLLAQIGYVSENMQLPEWMTVDYFLRYLKPFYPAWDDALAADLMREFQLPAGRPLRQLSRGMKMKAALASSLAYRPKLILLDEPFSGLDPLMRDEFIQGLLARAADTTVFVSSHDLAELETVASHVGFLDAGRLQFSEEISALLERFREIEVTLPAPFARPPHWPAHWLQPEISSALVRFVESRFQEGTTASDIAAIFPAATRISLDRLSLRQIFVTLAKDNRGLPA